LLQLWELCHRGSGYGALVLAVAAIYTGIKKLSPAPPGELPVSAAYLTWACSLAVFGGVLFLTAWYKERVAKAIDRECHVNVPLVPVLVRVLMVMMTMTMTTMTPTPPHRRANPLP
jgi:hypothetical protein